MWIFYRTLNKYIQIIWRLRHFTNQIIFATKTLNGLYFFKQNAYMYLPNRFQVITTKFVFELRRHLWLANQKPCMITMTSRWKWSIDPESLWHGLQCDKWFMCTTLRKSCVRLSVKPSSLMIMETLFNVRLLKSRETSWYLRYFCLASFYVIASIFHISWRSNTIVSGECYQCDYFTLFCQRLSKHIRNGIKNMKTFNAISLHPLICVSFTYLIFFPLCARYPKCK